MQPDDAQHLSSTNLSTQLSQLSQAQSECFIYKVHDHLRNVNDKAYEPEIIAIGPYHRDKNNLIMMKEHKLRYLQLILRRKNEHVEKFVSAIAPLEQEARNCYAEPISLNASQFIELLVLDGCFIIELLRKYNMPYLREENDPIFQMDWILHSLQRYLMLFENQIPFFVICKLFDLIEVPNQLARLIYLVLNFFHDIGKRPKGQRQDRFLTSSNEIKHLLDLVYSDRYISPDSPVFAPEVAATGNRLQLIDCATKLREANVKFRRHEEGSLYDVRFKNGTMVLPSLVIEDRTETFLRNMIAYEQYSQDKKVSSLTDYVILLNCLIDSSTDVEILSRYKIIDNWLGNDEEVANMFNKITESVSCPGKIFIYGKIFDDVNLHCKRRGNKGMAWLRRNLVLAVAVILVLTLIQTVCSVLQVV